VKDAFTIAAAFDRTVYDGTFAALAIAANAPLLTADERLANTLAARFPILWLGPLIKLPKPPGTIQVSAEFR